MFIQNISKRRAIEGDHVYPGKNSMLIQIIDPDGVFPQSKHKFKEVHQFRFLDIEKDDNWGEDQKITDIQANLLVNLLKHAQAKNMNVIVHCMAGICRSGAVCEVGVMLGFTDLNFYRNPNLLVKYKMMKSLGWTYE